LVDDKQPVPEPTKSSVVSDRRKLFRRFATLAGLGITGFLLSQKTGLIPPVQACNSGTLCYSDSSSSGNVISATATDTSGAENGIYGEADGTGCGVNGHASGSGFGVVGYSSSGFGGYFSTNNGVALWAVGDVGINTSTPSTALHIANYVDNPAGALALQANYVNVGDYQALTWLDVNGNVVAGIRGRVPVSGAMAFDFLLQPNGVTHGLTSITNVMTLRGDTGFVGIGTTSPARSVHLVGDNACFRMDRNVDSSAFILVRTDPTFSTVWKTFYVGVNASGVNNGEFFIGDAGTAVSGASTLRLWIDNGGTVHIPSLSNGDIKFANDFTVTEDKNDGLAFLNPEGQKIAMLDRQGNFHIKGKFMEDL